MKIYKTLLFTLLALCTVNGQQAAGVKPSYFYYPKAYAPWQYKTVLGLSVTKLPSAIVDDEINTLPMITSDFRIGLIKNVSMNLQFYTNYLANYGTVGLQWSLLNNDISFAIGENTSVWFGHLQLDGIHLKSMGVLVSPFFSIGYDTRDFMLTARVELQSSYLKTLSEEVLLGEFFRYFSAYNFQFAIEQPLWNEHWVVLGVKLIYAKFNYQSWLSYSAIDEYLFYPEFSFGFIL